MKSERDLEAVIANLETRSKRTQRFLLLGTLLVVASLVASAIYLNVLRARAEQRARIWEAKATALERTIEATGMALNGKNVAGATILADQALSQARDLVRSADRAGPSSPAIAKMGSRGSPAAGSGPQPPRPKPKTEASPPAPQTRLAATGYAIIINGTGEPVACGQFPQAWTSGKAVVIPVGGSSKFAAGDVRCVMGGDDIDDATLNPRGRYLLQQHSTDGLRLRPASDDEPSS
jgi:hypothetical protein